MKLDFVKNVVWQKRKGDRKRKREEGRRNKFGKSR